MHLSEFIYADIQEHGSSLLTFSFVDKTKEEILEHLQSDGASYVHKQLESFTTKKIIDVIYETLNIEKKKVAETKNKI